MTREEALKLVGSTALFERMLTANAALCPPKSPDLPLMDVLRAQDPKLHLFNASPRKFYVFDHQAERLMLCTVDELARLCLYLGAALYAHEIAAIVLKQEKKLILAALAPKIYRFVMDFARFGVPKLNVQLDLNKQADALKVFLQDTGAALLATLAADFTSPELKEVFLQRLQVKAPLEVEMPPTKIIRLSIEALVREDPSWMQYFS